MRSSAALKAYPVTLEHQVVSLRPAPRRKSNSRLLLPVLLFSALLLQLTMRIQIIRSQYRLEEVRAAALHNDSLYRELRFKYAALTGPLALQERAGKELRLRPTTPRQIRKVTLR